MGTQPTSSVDLLALTVDIVSAHVTNNSVAVGDLSVLIGKVHASLACLGEVWQPVQIEQAPAVTIRASIKPDYLVCLEDGKKLKMLKRHLMTRYQMTPADYRTKWKLPADYPMVAPNYAAQRSALAREIGLGRKRVPLVPAAAPTAAKKTPTRRKKLSVATQDG